MAKRITHYDEVSQDFIDKAFEEYNTDDVDPTEGDSKYADDLRTYFRDIGKYSHKDLTTDKIIEYAELYNHGKGDSSAGEELIKHNLKLVVHIAKQYIGRGVAFPDMIQEGNLGLMKAVVDFDYKKGSLSGYASYKIRSRILSAIYKANGLSEKDSKKILAITRICESENLQLTDDEILKIYNYRYKEKITLEELKWLKRCIVFSLPVPLDKPIDNDNNRPLYEVIPDEIDETYNPRELNYSFEYRQSEHFPELEKLLFEYESNYSFDYTQADDDVIKDILNLAEKRGIKITNNHTDMHAIKRTLNYYSKQTKQALLAQQYEDELKTTIIELKSKNSLFKEILVALQKSYETDEEELKRAVNYLAKWTGLNDQQAEKVLRTPTRLSDYYERRIVLLLGFLKHLDSAEVNRLLVQTGHDALYARMPGDSTLIFAYNHKLSLDEWENLYQETIQIINQYLDPYDFILQDSIGLNAEDVSNYLEELNRYDDKYATPTSSITSRVSDRISKTDTIEEFLSAVNSMRVLYVSLRQRSRRIILEALLEYIKTASGQSQESNSINMSALTRDYVDYYGWGFSGRYIKFISDKLTCFLKGIGDYSMLDRITFIAFLSFLLHNSAKRIELGYFNSLIEMAGFLPIFPENNGLDWALFNMMAGSDENRIIYREQLMRCMTRNNKHTLVEIQKDLYKKYGLKS